MYALVAAIGAVVVGVGDFAGGTASRKDSPHAVATISFLVGSVFLAALVPFTAGSPTANDLIWGATSGVGGGLGVFALYRGFGKAPMGLVSPIAGVIAVAIPVAAGVLGGERLGAVTIVGLVVGAAAIILVSTPRRTDQAGSHLSGVGHGIVTGLGFGVQLLALALVGDGAGLLPVVAGRSLSFVLLAAHALVAGRMFFPAPGTRLLGSGAGVLTSGGVLLYYLAVGLGPIVISTAIYAMFPVSTLLMARLIHHERLAGLQMVGVALALLAGIILATASV